MSNLNWCYTTSKVDFGIPVYSRETEGIQVVGNRKDFKEIFSVSLCSIVLVVMIFDSIKYIFIYIFGKIVIIQELTT